MRLTKCKICRTPYAKKNIMHKVCSAECSLELVAREKEQKARKQHLADKIRLRSRREWLKLAQTAFNAYVRTRDELQPCISCGRHHTGQYHAGHYLSTGARPELRFDESNNHKQCSACNNYLSGNIALYRKNLIIKIGLEEVERLEGDHTPRKYSIEELQEIKTKYTAKLKEMKSEALHTDKC